MIRSVDFIWKNAYSLTLARIACVCVFWGRAWQHIFWDAPLRTLLWDEQWMRPVVEGLLGGRWTSYVTNPAVDSGIEWTIHLVGGFYLLAGLAALWYPRGKAVTVWIIRAGGVLLFGLALLYWKEKFYFFGQLFEYSLQVFTPFLFLWLAKNPTLDPPKQWTLKIIIALTFSCHGLYAIGFYPRPENFMTMTMQILGLGNEAAKMFLNFAGIADFVLSVFLFLPWRKIQIAALMYAVFWGTLTSVARIWAYFYPAIWEESLHQWFYQFLYRVPHFLLPAILLFTYLMAELKKRPLPIK